LVLDPGARPAIIGDRVGQIVPDGADGPAPNCLVQVVHRDFTSRTGEERIERLRVSTYGPQSTETLCQIAADLTAAAVAKLPQPD
jgi:hypothetical protein